MTKTQCQATFSPSSWQNYPVSQKAKPKRRASKAKVTAKDLHSKIHTLEWKFSNHLNTMKRSKDTVINLGSFIENYREKNDRVETEKEEAIDAVEQEIEELKLLKHTNRGYLEIEWTD